MTISTAAVCAAFFSLVATSPNIDAHLKSSANAAVQSIIDSSEDVKALDDEANAVFAMLKSNPAMLPQFMKASTKPCVDYAVKLDEAHYD